MKKLIILFMAFAPLFAMGQNQSPLWVKGYFSDLENSYLETVSAFGYDVESARKKALSEVINRRNLATGAELSISYGKNDISVRSDDNTLIIKARVVDEYVNHETSGYRVYLLVQTAKNPMYELESVEVSNEYSFSARNLVPGMAQIYKGSKGKGLTIIAAEALSVASIIVCENQRASYANKAIEQPKFAKEYCDKANNYETGRNISIGLSAGIWIYNIIDASVSKGQKRVFIKNLSMTPYATYNGNAGFSLAYKF